MNVPVLWCSRHPDILARGYADQGLIEAILARDLWTPPDAMTFTHHEVRGDFPDVEGALVLINCRTHASNRDVQWLQEQLGRLSWAVVILCGDEEWVFPWRAVRENAGRRVWVMQPRPEHAGLSGLIPGGWYPWTRELLKPCAREASERPLDWFFGGQVTHGRRQACAEALRGLGGGYLYETAGYLQGMDHDEYMGHLAGAKVVPCPSGPMTVDTARPLEAMEAGCVPVVDTTNAKGESYDYWTLIFGDGHPLRTISDWSTFGGVLAGELGAWPHNANRVFAFWQQWKRRIARQLDSDLRAVMGRPASPSSPDDLVTVVMPTSPAPLHPSTGHLEQTFESVRAQLPLAEIVLVADGVRPEQEHRRTDYEEYLRRLLWLCNFEWHNVVPVVLDEWGHQANATRAALALVDTPLVLFVEHDTPLVGEIPWAALCDVVASGEANAIRLHQDVAMHPDHEAVMLDPEPRVLGDKLPCRRTSAWWQRPHLASTRFYRDRIMPMFGPGSRTMIEEVVYDAMARDCGTEAGWWDWRVWIYTPAGDMRRSGHLDSRGDDPKYEMWL